MCGLAGIAGDMTVALRDAFKDLLVVTQFRGRDATGTFVVRNDNEYDYMKCLGTPELLIDRKTFDDRILKGLPKILAGHCRSKTAGDNTIENAHPYDCESLIGMHNGTLKSYYQMEGYDYKRTDSSLLFQHIAAYGLEETFQKIDPEGAWALVWWDATDNRLNFLRNEQRPLWFAWTKDKRAMIWASEPWMFGAIHRRVELWDGKGEEGEKDRSPYFQLPPNELWSFSVEGFAKKDERPLTLHPIREVKAEGKKPENFSRTTTMGFNGTGSYRNPHRVPYHWEKKNEGAETGGEVDNPFLLDDPVNDVGKPPLLLTPPDSTASPDESQTTSTTVTESSKSSAQILDFRPPSMRGKNSSRKTLSLPSTKSNSSRRTNKGKPSGESKESTCEESATNLSASNQKVSLRLIKALGETYITDNKTGTEWSAREFESRNDGVCSFCREPIGDLSQVHEIFNDGKMFLCTSCIIQPKACIVG